MDYVHTPDMYNWEERITDLEEENKELREKNEALQSANASLVESVYESARDMSTAISENVELKRKIENQRIVARGLEYENERLKNAADDCHSRYLALRKAIKGAITEHDRTEWL